MGGWEYGSMGVWECEALACINGFFSANSFLQIRSIHFLISKEQWNLFFHRWTGGYCCAVSLQQYIQCFSSPEWISHFSHLRGIQLFPFPTVQMQNLTSAVYNDGSNPSAGIFFRT